MARCCRGPSHGGHMYSPPMLGSLHRLPGSGGGSRAGRCLPSSVHCTLLVPVPGGERVCSVDAPCLWSLRHTDGEDRSAAHHDGSREDMPIICGPGVLTGSLRSSDSCTFPESSLAQLGYCGLWTSTDLRQGCGALCRPPVTSVLAWFNLWHGPNP